MMPAEGDQAYYYNHYYNVNPRKEKRGRQNASGGCRITHGFYIALFPNEDRRQAQVLGGFAFRIDHCISAFDLLQTEAGQGSNLSRRDIRGLSRTGRDPSSPAASRNRELLLQIAPASRCRW